MENFIKTSIKVGTKKFQELIEITDKRGQYDFQSLFYKGQIYPYKTFVIDLGEKRYLEIRYLFITKETRRFQPHLEPVITVRSYEIRNIIIDRREINRMRLSTKYVNICGYSITKDGVEIRPLDDCKNDLSDVINSYYEFITKMVNLKYLSF